MPLKRSPLARKTPLRRTGFKRQQSTPLKRTPMKRVGKKTREWDTVRADLKKRFAAAGITECELKRPGCWRNNGLGFAHSLKRRNITNPENLREVVLACNVCHDQIEALPELDMMGVVVTVIRARKVAV